MQRAPESRLPMWPLPGWPSTRTTAVFVSGCSAASPLEVALQPGLRADLALSGYDAVASLGRPSVRAVLTGIG